MDHKDGLKICILLCSITYQIWLVLTILIMLFYENWLFKFDSPAFIRAYVKSIYGFMENPMNIPFTVLFLFVLGGICMGMALNSNARTHIENWFKSFAKE